MLTKSRITVAAGLAALALGAPPALAMPDARGEHAASLSENRAGSGSTAVDARGEYAASQSENRAGSGITMVDARGEHAASLSGNRAGSGTIAVDARGEFARDPIVPPVVVEIDDPVSGGFDWTAGMIGLAGGVAVAVLAGAAVAGGRRRSFRPSVG